MCLTKPLHGVYCCRVNAQQRRHLHATCMLRCVYCCTFANCMSLHDVCLFAVQVVHCDTSCWAMLPFACRIKFRQSLTKPCFNHPLFPQLACRSAASCSCFFVAVRCCMLSVYQHHSPCAFCWQVPFCALPYTPTHSRRYAISWKSQSGNLHMGWSFQS